MGMWRQRYHRGALAVLPRSCFSSHCVPGILCVAQLQRHGIKIALINHLTFLFQTLHFQRLLGLGLQEPRVGENAVFSQLSRSGGVNEFPWEQHRGRNFPSSSNSAV